MSTADFLKQTPLFSGLTDDEIATVLATAKRRTFDKGTEIIHEGHVGGAGFYLVTEGAVDVFAQGKFLATHAPGGYFGEMALLLDDTPRTASCVASEDTVCIVITKWDLRSLVETHPDISMKIMAELARRLRDTNQAVGG
ncbi:MAG: Crp/Fnr family transcriptional regulator [Acidimicrobiia bacterium]